MRPRLWPVLLQPMTPVLAFSACMLAGCAAAKPAEVTTVQVPVSISCIHDVPMRPTPTFGTGDWPGDKAAAQAALMDAAAWEGYATKLEVVVAGCR